MSGSGRKIPGSRLGRLARLATVSARTGANMLLNREAATEEVARKAAEALGTLRGVAAKVGQMAGYVDGVIPEGQRDAYEKWMQKLLAAAPASSPAAVRRLVEEELGAPIDQLFAEWSETPIASASIGQVHRARLPDGQEVAVKVQHPGVARAVESDLQNAGLLERTVAVVGGSKLESRRILEEVRTRFREELDYQIEATRQRRFAEFFNDDPQVVIPTIHERHSSKRVLTSRFIRGANFDEARSAPEPERAAWARAQWRFVYKGTLVGGMFNADPHPGNYFFLPGGQVAFIDFGCVQPVTPERMRLGSATHRAASNGDRREFERAGREMLGLRGGAHERRALAYLHEAFRPQFESPFRMTRSYVAALVDQFRQIATASIRERDGSFVSFPPGVFFLNRLQFGFYSVLARLDVEVDYAAIERGFL